MIHSSTTTQNLYRIHRHFLSLASLFRLLDRWYETRRVTPAKQYWHGIYIDRFKWTLKRQSSGLNLNSVTLPWCASSNRDKTRGHSCEHNIDYYDENWQESLHAVGYILPLVNKTIHKKIDKRNTNSSLQVITAGQERSPLSTEKFIIFQNHQVPSAYRQASLLIASWEG